MGLSCAIWADGRESTVVCSARHLCANSSPTVISMLKSRSACRVGSAWHRVPSATCRLMTTVCRNGTMTAAASLASPAIITVHAMPSVSAALPTRKDSMSLTPNGHRMQKIRQTVSLFSILCDSISNGSRNRNHRMRNRTNGGVRDCKYENRKKTASFSSYSIYL